MAVKRYPINLLSRLRNVFKKAQSTHTTIIIWVWNLAQGGLAVAGQAVFVSAPGMVGWKLVRAVTGPVAHQAGSGIRTTFVMGGNWGSQGGSVSPASSASTGARYQQQETDTEGKDLLQEICLTFSIVATRHKAVKKREPRGLLSALWSQD
jgi:hypothetical protein